MCLDAVLLAGQHPADDRLAAQIKQLSIWGSSSDIYPPSLAASAIVAVLRLHCVCTAPATRLG